MSNLRGFDLYYNQYLQAGPFSLRAVDELIVWGSILEPLLVQLKGDHPQDRLTVVVPRHHLIVYDHQRLLLSSNI